MDLQTGAKTWKFPPSRVNLWYTRGTAHCTVHTTEYTQRGNCRFLAYIPSWWKNQPWLVRVRGGGARPPPFTLFTIMYKVAVFAPAEGQIHFPFSSIPYMFSVLQSHNHAISNGSVTKIWQKLCWQSWSKYTNRVLFTSSLNICPEACGNK